MEPASRQTPNDPAALEPGSARPEPIVKSIRSHKRFNRFLRLLGPGVVTGAADDDPSGIATYSQAGSAYGYGFLWAFPLMYPLLVGVQEACTRIGAVTGKGLAAVIKENYNRKLLLGAVVLVVVANTINIGADIGAMVAATRLLLPLPFVALAVFFALTVIYLEVAVRYKTYVKVLKWLSLALFAYPVTAFLVGQPWGEVLRATLLPKLNFNFDSAYILVGMLGTTISPYLFFWDTAETVEDEIVKHRLSPKSGQQPHVTRRFIRSLRMDNFIGMTMASLGAWFIVITTASVLFANGITQINTAADAAKALEPLVGGFPHAGLVAKLIFSVGIVGLGLLAVPVLAGSSSYAISEALGWREGLHYRYKRARGFYSIIGAATLVGLLMNFLGINPVKALIFAAVFNGVAAIPLLWMIARIGRSGKIMGDYRSGWLSNLTLRVTFAAMLAAALILLLTAFFNP